MCKKIAFITAGGTGDRMNTMIPKQFLELHNIPVIVRTMLKFENCASVDTIIVACLQGWEDRLWNLSKEYGVSKLSAIVSGGENSQKSIFNGAEYMLNNGFDKDDIVIVHESVRPFISNRIIEDNIETCVRLGNAVTAIRGNESYLYSEDGRMSQKAFLREAMYKVQTPQTFRLGVLYEALNTTIQKRMVYQSPFLMISEFYKIPLNIVDGDRFNLKLTYPEDLKIFETLYSLEQNG